MAIQLVIASLILFSFGCSSAASASSVRAVGSSHIKNNNKKQHSFRYTRLTPADIQSGADGKPLLDALKHSKEAVAEGQCIHPAPPRGWDSFDAYPIPVVFDESTLLQTAELIANNLDSLNYVIIDEGWAEVGIGQWMLDAYGRPIPNTILYPSTAETGGFAPLAAKLQQRYNQSLGLWIIKGIPKMAVDMNLPIKNTEYTAADIALTTNPCPWHTDVFAINMTHPGGRAYYRSLVDLYVREWGVSYIKMDCVFGTQDLDEPEVYAMSGAMNNANPASVLSLSPGANWDASLAPVGKQANAFRITGDLHDCWSTLQSPCSGHPIIDTTKVLMAVQPYLDRQKIPAVILDADDSAAEDAPPAPRSISSSTTAYRFGSFPDPDMLPIGDIRVGKTTGKLTRSLVSKDNMVRYIIGMWSITRSPLILGGQVYSVLYDLGGEAQSWLSNSYLIAMHACSANPTIAMQQEQNAAGDHGLVVWALQHGTIENALYVGIFPFSNSPNATYKESVTLEQDNILGRFASPSTTAVSYFLIFDTVTGDQIGQQVTRQAGGTFPVVSVGANDCTLLTILAFS